MSQAVIPRNLPTHVPRISQSFNGHVPVRFEGLPGGPFEGDVRWVGVPRFEHADLCRAFGLDQASYSFDLPSSVRGIGSMQQGYGGGRSARFQSGFVFRGMPGQSAPVAKIVICREGERFDDVDPLSRSDAEDLSRY